MSLNLTSPAFEDQGSIPAKYTCDGADINPPLEIKKAPVSTKSLVLIVDDPDAPRQAGGQASGDWVHWILWNIAPDASRILENSVPAGSIEGTTDFNRAGWGGPCPPSGVHRYQFRLYALDARLGLPSTARKSDLEAAMQGHILEQTMLVGLYERQ